jgi:broad specificity phosphatase PhoE
MPDQSFSDFLNSQEQPAKPSAKESFGDFVQPLPQAAAPAPKAYFANEPDGSVQRSTDGGMTWQSLPTPQRADQQTTFNAQTIAEVATRPTPGIMDYLRLGGAAIGAANEGVNTALTAPLADVGAMLPKSLGPGAIRGGADVLSGLTSPANIGMLALFPEGEAGKLLSLGFSSQQIVDAAKQVPEFTDAVKKKDWGRARQTAVQIIVPTLMAAVGAKHGRTAEKLGPARVTSTMARDSFETFIKEQNATPAASPVEGPAAKPPAQGEPQGPPKRAKRRQQGKPRPAAEPSPAPAPTAATAEVGPHKSAAKKPVELFSLENRNGGRTVLAVDKTRATRGYTEFDEPGLPESRMDIHKLQPGKITDKIQGYPNQDWMATLADHGYEPKDVVGYVDFNPNRDGDTMTPGMAYVHPDFRRAGVATSMYGLGQSQFPEGHKLGTSVGSSEYGKAFRKTYDVGNTRVPQEAAGGRNREFFRGAWDIDLNAEGRRQVAEAGRKNPGQFDEIYSGTRQRHQDTAQAFADTNPQAGPVQASDRFNPMDLGAHEGEDITPERLRTLNEHIRERTAEPLPGTGKFSGKPGEAPAAWADRLIGGVQDVVKKWKPGEKKLIVTSGRDVQAIRAWVAKGMPEDRSVDLDVLTKPWKTQPGQMMHFDPETGKIADVDKATGDGIYFARHGETAGNNNPEVPAEVQALEQKQPLLARPDSKQITEIMDASGLRIFGVRSLHENETPVVGQTMAESHVWDDGDRTDESIGGTCCFEIRENADPALAMRRAESYTLSGRYALIGGEYQGNNDLISEPHAIAIRDARVLAVWTGGASERGLHRAQSERERGDGAAAPQPTPPGEAEQRVAGVRGTGEASGGRTAEPPAAAESAAVAGAKSRLKSRLRELAAGETGEQRFDLSTQDLEDLATVGAHYLRQFGARLADWSDAMRREFGDRVTPYLNSVYVAAVGKRQLETIKDSPAGIGIGELREEVPAPKREFDQALLHLYRQNEVDLDKHDFPQGMSQAEQDHYLTPDGRGNHYVMASAAPAPQPAARGPVDPFATMHGGIPLDVVAAIFRADIGEMKALWEKRRQALAELEKSKETPAETEFGRKVISYFVGERDVWGARVNQVMARLRKIVPDPVEQEGLFLMRDFRGREPEMLSFLDGSHPTLQETGVNYAKAMDLMEKVRPAIMQALNPTPRMLQADQALTKISAGTLKEGQRLQMLESRWTPEQYAPHLLGRKGEGDFAQPMRDRMGRQLGGKMGKYFQFAQARDFPTALHALAHGYRPRTLNAFDAFTIHGDKFATARATRLLENQLVDTGVGRYAAQGRSPQGWVRLAPHSNEFRKLVPFLRQGPAVGSAQAAAAVAQQKLAGMKAGQSYAQVSAQAAQQIATGQGGTVVPDVAELGLWVPDYVEKALQPITDPDYMGRIPAFKWVRRTQSWQKAVQLGLSLFHATTENFMALANMGARGWAQALKADRLDPDFEKAERDFIAHGGTTSIQGHTVEAYKALQPGSIPNWVDVWRKGPVIHQVDQLAGQLTEFTFNNLQRRFKVTDYALHQAAWMADHPNATTAELIAAKASIAKEINAVYGGLHAELLGISRAVAETARAIFLAPDWTFSNVFNVKYALERGTAGGKLARAFWARQIVGGMVATQLLSLALSQKLSPNPTQVYFGKDKEGQDIYQNVFFKGASGDVINLAHNVSDYGAVEGLARTVSAKSAGLVRMGTQILTNRDYLGHEIVNRNLDPIAGTLRGAAKIVEAGAPIPFTVTNVKDMLIGPHAEDYTAPEFLTTFFGGTPPRHVPPEGFKMTPEGLEEKEPEAERNSLLDQIRTGKAFAGRQ